MRSEPSILHVDLDAFFAAVEQRDKPSLRGKPVVVGGLGPRGVVATASYEARVFGVQSAMPTAQARARCPNAAFLYPRFHAYQQTSAQIMRVLRRYSPLIEPLSLDEAFADLAEGGHADLSSAAVRQIATDLKAEIAAETGLPASVGAATSKFVAKLASDLDKPNGLRIVEPGAERDLLRPLPVSRLWGVGPATAVRLHAAGIHTIGELEGLALDELTGLIGQAWGTQLFHLARAEDDRPVVAEREAKSVSVEETYDRDILDPARLHASLDLLTIRLVRRLERNGLSGRTVNLKVRLYDFTTLTRSATQPGPTSQVKTITRIVRRLLDDIDVSGGVRLLGVGVSGLADWAQGDLFDADWLTALADDGSSTADPTDHRVDPMDPADPTDPTDPTHRQIGAAASEGEPGAASGPVAARGIESPIVQWRPGQDVRHRERGPGWVWGTGKGLVTIRFETRDRPAGPVLTFDIQDEALAAVDLDTGGADSTEGPTPAGAGRAAGAQASAGEADAAGAQASAGEADAPGAQVSVGEGHTPGAQASVGEAHAPCA